MTIWRPKWPATIAFAALIGSAQPGPRPAAASEIDYGKPGEPIHLAVGYQPYYSESWSGVVINGLELWKKHLPPGSTVEFNIGLQGSIIVNAMLAGKESIGYLGDMPAIVATTKRQVGDLRIVASIGLGYDECNVIFVRNDAPQFANADEAVAWLDGKTVASPKGSCADRFARAVFDKKHVNPTAYLNQSIEVITSGFRAGKLDGAVLWEPTATRLAEESLARRVGAGNNFDERDGAFIDMRADLIQQRPDVVKGWLEAELEAEQYLADPKNAVGVAELAQAQTTGFQKKELWRSLFGAYSAEVGGAPIRLTLPFGFTAPALEHIKKATTFLFTIKSIDTPELAPDAVLPNLTADILKERGLTAPVGEIKAQPDSALP
jgi:NitT/TauT family transport system substrate-binding protein